MTSLINHVKGLHDVVFSFVERITEGWFLGLFARFVFAAVLWGYFFELCPHKSWRGLLGVFLGFVGRLLPDCLSWRWKPPAVMWMPWPFSHGG